MLIEYPLSYFEMEVKTLENTTDTALQLAQISDSIAQTNTMIGAIIVISGIVISFVIVQFLWRYIFKPILRDYVKLPL